MIIGMRGHDFGRMEPGALASAIAEAGFRATQLAFTKAFPEPASAYMTQAQLLRIRELFAAQGICLPVLGCYISASDRDDAIRQRAKETFSECLRASVVLGTRCVGTETTHFTFDESERGAAYARLLDFMHAVIPVAQDCGATIGIEPVAGHTLNTPELTRRLLNEVASPHVQVILDLANLLTPQSCSPQAQRDILDRCLTLWGDKVCVLHIKDGVFGADGKWIPRPMGEGVMDWKTILPILRAHDDSLCVLREGVWPGRAQAECQLIKEWLNG